MTDRLDPDDADQERAVEMLRSARRAEPSAAVQARVRSRLDTENRGRVRRSPLAWALLCLLLASVTATASTIVVRAIQSVRAARRTTIPPVAPIPTTKPLSRKAQEGTTATPGAPANLLIVPSAPAPPALTPPAQTETIRSEHRSVLPPARDPLPKAVDAREYSLVYDAAKALHKNGDVSRARTLLDEYLQSFPDGQLAEEAYALAMEAAEKSEDHEASSLARRYLARFPSGRYGAQARRVIAADSQ